MESQNEIRRFRPAGEMWEMVLHNSGLVEFFDIRDMEEAAEYGEEPEPCRRVVNGEAQEFIRGKWTKAAPWTAQWCDHKIRLWTGAL